MKKQVRFLACALCLLLLTGACLAEGSPPEIVDLGVPSAETYSEKQCSSRNPWAMTVCDGVLYVGSGDYSEKKTTAAAAPTIFS